MKQKAKRTPEVLWLLMLASLSDSPFRWPQSDWLNCCKNKTREIFAEQEDTSLLSKLQLVALI